MAVEGELEDPRAEPAKLVAALAHPVEAVDPLERGGPDITDAVG
jgi:hypothetical protein